MLRTLANVGLKLANRGKVNFRLGQPANKQYLSNLFQYNSKYYSSQNDNLPKVHFEELQSCQKDKNVLIIDVREPQELVDYGVIDGSINIPLGEVEQVLKTLPKDEFLKRYNRPKPDESSSIIFTCQRGIRSEKAQILAQQLGYKNVKNYIGGWLDWAEKIKKR